MYCGIVGDAGLEVKEEAEEAEDSALVLVLADMEERIESARSGMSADKVAVMALVLFASTVVVSASCRVRCRSLSSGGERRGLLGGLPTIFQLLSADGFWDWMGRGETRGGVTRPDGLFSIGAWC